VGAGDAEAAGADRQRRERRILAGRVRRIAAETRHADLAVAALVVRPEVVVRERPVVGHAVEAPDAEVGGEHPRPRAGEQDHRPADTGEHQRRHVGPLVVDGVVLGQRTDVGARRPLLPCGELPVELGTAVLGAVVPGALLEAHHADPGLGEPPRHHTTRRAGADDEDRRVR
jgi:hypothetical protein